jgi:hypothetical protein
MIATSGAAGVHDLGAALAVAADAVHGDHSTTRFLAQLVLILVVGRSTGELLHRLGLSAVMGQVIAGILLGPSVFGALLPDLHHLVFPESREQWKMIEAIAQIGVLMLLLLTGMETDFGRVNRVRRAAVSVSISGIAIPFGASCWANCCRRRWSRRRSSATSPRCSWARRCRSPRSRSWLSCCRRWTSCGATSAR